MNILLDIPAQPKDIDLLGLLMLPIFLILAALWVSQK
jgi:hypothetical protein